MSEGSGKISFEPAEEVLSRLRVEELFFHQRIVRVVGKRVYGLKVKMKQRYKRISRNRSRWLLTDGPLKEKLVREAQRIERERRKKKASTDPNKRVSLGKKKNESTIEKQKRTGSERFLVGYNYAIGFELIQEKLKEAQEELQTSRPHPREYKEITFVPRRSYRRPRRESRRSRLRREEQETRRKKEAR